MPKMLAGIRRIADLDSTPSAALPIPYSDESIAAPSSATEKAADLGVTASVASAYSDDAWAEAIAAEPIADDGPEADIILATEMVAPSAPAERYAQHVQTPLFAERTQPFIPIEHRTIAPEPFFSHQRAHDEMLRRAAPHSPSLSLAQRIAAVDVATPAINQAAPGQRNHAVTIYQPADAETAININPISIEASNHHQSYEDGFLQALAEQESARENIQTRMQEQFLAHEQAHEEMLRRIRTLTPALALEAADAHEQARSNNDLEPFPPLESHQPSVPFQSATITAPLAHALRQDQPIQRAIIASAVPTSAAIDWQPLDNTGKTKRRRKPARPAVPASRAIRDSIARSMARTAATLVFASGAYFAIELLTEQRLDSLRLAAISLVQPSETQIAAVANPASKPSVAPAKVATVASINPPLDQSMPLPRVAADPSQPSIALTPSLAEVVQPPVAAAQNSLPPAIPVPVPMPVRIGQLNPAELTTISRLVHPPVLIRKRQQIAAAVRPSDQDFDPRSVPGNSPRNPGQSLALAVEQGAAAAALPAIVPPKPSLVRESLVRTALAQPPRHQMTDVLATANSDTQQPSPRVAIINRTQAIGAPPIPRPARPTRVAALDPSRQTHATVGIEARAIVSIPSRTTTATAAWRRGEHLYARATLGRGQHAPDYGFSGEGPHAAHSSNGQRDSYISILGFHVRRAQPIWASRLFDNRQ